MPPSRSLTSVDSDSCKQLLKNLPGHPLLIARVRHAEIITFEKYLRPLEGKQRCFPSILMTQASGRWSFKDPPLNNLAKDEVAIKRGLPKLRSIIWPDLGTWWLCWDLDAVEAKFAAAYSGDLDDLEAFNNNWDIHVLTTCDAYRHPRPPNPTKKWIASDDAQEWRNSWNPPFLPVDDLRRSALKTARYACTYAPVEKGEYAILEAPGLDDIGLSRQQAVEAARMFLASKPKLMAWKRVVSAECIRTKESRTFLGRRRKLFGSRDDMAKQGLNHKIQGAVSQVMDLTIKGVLGALDQARLIVQAHDGAKVQLPISVSPRAAYDTVRPIVEKTWDVEGTPVTFTASWEMVDDKGDKGKI